MTDRFMSEAEMEAIAAKNTAHLRTPEKIAIAKASKEKFIVTFTVAGKKASTLASCGELLHEDISAFLKTIKEAFPQDAIVAMAVTQIVLTPVPEL